MVLPLARVAAVSTGLRVRAREHGLLRHEAVSYSVEAVLDSKLVGRKVLYPQAG